MIFNYDATHVIIDLLIRECIRRNFVYGTTVFIGH